MIECGEAIPSRTLAEVATLWDSLHKTPQYVESGWPMVRVTDLRRGYLDTSSTVKVTEDAFKEFTKRYRPRSGDSILSRVGSYGITSFVSSDEHFCLGQNTVCISPNRSFVDPYFLYAFLNSPSADDQIESRVGGSSQPTISLKNIGTIELPCPSISVQRTISRMLKAYDDLIENNARRIAILEEMARRLYEEWFVRFRFPGHEGVPMIASELGLVPQGWDISPITKIAVVKYGKGLPTKHLADDSPFPVYGASKVIGYYTEYTREARTLIVGCRGSVGVPQITLPRCFVTNNSFTVDSNNPNGLLWLFLAMQSRGLKDVVGGSAQPQITLEGLAGATFIAPTGAVIELFDALVRPIYELVWNLADKNANLRTTRDLLLPKLISGELDVSTLPEPQAETA